MIDGPQAARLPDGRLHLHQGPIDLIITAEGPGREAAFASATARFQTILTELVGELEVLTQSYDGMRFKGGVANRMAEAVGPLSTDRFVTPMAAVAGAVADEILSAMGSHELRKATVNNGGDIAFILTKGETFVAAAPTGTVHVDARDPARGVATSGWRGRSHSLGIADAVTVLARTAARADGAATLIANAVDLPKHPAISRQLAHDVEAVPQLRDRLVTTDVGPLSADDKQAALQAGLAYAEDLATRGLIESAVLLLQGETRVTASRETVPEISGGRS